MISGLQKVIDIGEGPMEVETSGWGPDFVIIRSLLSGPKAFDEMAAWLASGLTVHPVLPSRVRCLHALVAETDRILTKLVT